MTRPTSPVSASSAPIVIWTIWCYRRLLSLHPPPFRHAFGVSILQVFRETCLTAYRQHGTLGVMSLWPRALGDVTQGAFAEYAECVFSYLRGSATMMTYRRSSSSIFGAYIAFILAGMGFAKMSEEVMKSPLPAEHPIFAISYTIVLIGSVFSLLAILIGGLPLAFAALRFALTHRRRDILLRFAVPPSALFAIIGATWLIITLKLGGNTVATIHTLPRILSVGGLLLLFLLGAVVSTIAVLDAIARSEIDERLLRFTIVPGISATVAMASMLAGTLSWNVGLWQIAPTLFWGNEGILASSTILGVVGQVVLMAGATIIAVRAVTRDTAAQSNN